MSILKKSTNRIVSLAVEIIGWCLVLAGIAALALPGPGLLAIFAGLTLLSTRYEWAERRLEPVHQAALKAAHESVSSLPKLLGSSLAALALIGLGIVWGIGLNIPAWWPLHDKYWLIGGWGTGGTLIGSGIIAGSMLIYSYIRFRSK
jgi:uncharacterized protein (TIGR02611 family)